MAARVRYTVKTMNGELLIFPDAGVNKDVSLAASRCQTGSHWSWRVLLSVPCVDTQRKSKKNSQCER